MGIMLGAIVGGFWVIFIGLTLYGLRRGVSSVFCLGVLLFLAGWLATQLAPTCTSVFPNLAVDAKTYLGTWQLILLFLFAIGAFPLGAYLNRFFQVNLDPFDQLIGGLLGIIIAGWVTHVFLASFLLIYHKGVEATALDHLFIVRQFVYLDGWNEFTHWFSTLRSSHTMNVPE